MSEGPPFVVKTYQILTDYHGREKKIVGWSNGGDSIIIHDPVTFENQVLSQYFKHNNFCSFVRQLSNYGFQKVESGNWEFKNENFIHGKPELLKNIVRRKSKKRESNSNVIPEEKEEVSNVSDRKSMEGDDEIEKVKGINNLLMKEVNRLQDQQEKSTEIIKQLIAAVVQTRKEQQALKNKVEELTMTVHNLTNENSSNPQLFSNISSPTQSDFPDLNDLDNLDIDFSAILSDLDSLNTLEQF